MTQNQQNYFFNCTVGHYVVLDADKAVAIEVPIQPGRTVQDDFNERYPGKTIHDIFTYRHPGRETHDFIVYLNEKPADLTTVLREGDLLGYSHAKVQA